MLVCLDANIVICAVEGEPTLQQRVRNHVAALETSGARFMVSELTETECLVFPFRTANGPLLLDSRSFLQGIHISTVPLTAAIHRRAAMTRGVHNFGLADSLHLASAIENRLDRFLTNDRRLTSFPDITVEILP